METKSLSNRITDYVLGRSTTTLTELEGVVVSAGFTLDELYAALNQVHKNKAIRRTVRQGEVVYLKALPPKEPGSHLSWTRTHYPPMDSTNNGSGFDIDYSYLFLSPDALLEYKAAARNIPKHMIQSSHGHHTRR
jgi:hypothetical protein